MLQSYTFRSYFELPYEPDDILAEFGYRLQRAALNLPQSTAPATQLRLLKAKLEQRLTYVSLISETARRETLIAPILLEAAEVTGAQVRIEYLLNVSEVLKGSLDYYLYRNSKVIVLEARNADLARGFTQLAVELSALDQWLENDQPTVLGAVTTGDIWQFGQLHRQEKLIIQGIRLFVISDELEAVFEILRAALE
ncbi:hypothetical protein HJG54_16640 [Leptolyngbya sp. NK1-12]|uniref:Uncharacterized protein n=1 Tax=Leptolyngbya sp. NK1-12 TaxID=2547451 RepID=A0AA96WFV8_9CYAN|nr:hypothetical protein [Leptolyngbya sp. NK1-12]WNZ24325.1 hypothetical protein HJG54_16640 [Leptolyngbya sp. NK1-12]